MGVRHFNGHHPLQLVVMCEIDHAETALAQQLLDPVAPDVRGRGRIAWGWVPSGLVYGLVRVVHARRPAPGHVWLFQRAAQEGILQSTKSPVPPADSFALQS